jgi:hypothetical protein
MLSVATLERAIDRSIESLLAPADRFRNRFLLRTRPLSGLLAAHRDLRVAVLGVAMVFVAALATFVAPLWMLALGPVLLGVPHLYADVRYCVIRRGWHHDRAMWICVFAPLVMAGLGGGLAVGLAAVGGVILLRARSNVALLVGLAAVTALALVVVRHPAAASLCTLHGHNVVAIVLWVLWRKRARACTTLVVASIVAGAAALAVVPLPAFTFTAAMPQDLALAAHLERFAPGLEGSLAIRVVLLFCFLQSVHYSVWLRLVPEDDRDRATPRTLAASYRALRSESGPLLLVAVAAGVLGLAAWALLDLAAAHEGYLRFARFHFSLELCLLAALWTERLGHVTGTRPRK